MIIKKIFNIFRIRISKLQSRQRKTLHMADRQVGRYPRKIAVLKQLKDFEKWKTKVSYNSRWMAETVFSSLKRMFGEYIMYQQRNFQHD